MVLSFARGLINVNDMERSVVFYRDKLGLRVVYDNRMTDPGREEIREAVGEALGVPGVDLRWVVMEAPGEGAGREIELLQWFNPKPQPLLGKRNVCDEGIAWRSFKVANVREAFEQLKSQGVKFRGSLGEMPSRGSGVCYCLDPDGHVVELGGPL